MKREKYLWPLSQSHHRALMAAKKIREGLSGPGVENKDKTLGELSAEVRGLFDDELRRHFWDEERILGLFEARFGKDDPDAGRIRREHRFLESLLSQNTAENLLRFSETLVLHIRFEEDLFFARIEGIFNESDARTVEEILRPLSVSPLV